MSVVCVIPSKPYDEAKTRLAPILTPDQRVELSRLLLLRTVRLAHSLLDEVVVVSRDRDLLEDVRIEGALPLPERGRGLNAALTQAAGALPAARAGGVLVLPADLALVTARDILEILHQAVAPRSVVLAPCQREVGTNALLVQPPLLIPYAFGVNSFARHTAAARAAGVQPVVIRSPTLAFDLDTPADWQVVRHEFEL
jgi:2-phospho-L-lactate guanylyltransferase